MTYVRTEVFIELKRLDDAPWMNESWSKPSAHTLLFGEPRNFVGVNAPSMGSNEPDSSATAPAGE